jgi:hypothetical protein
VFNLGLHLIHLILDTEDFVFLFLLKVVVLQPDRAGLAEGEKFVLFHILISSLPATGIPIKFLVFGKSHNFFVLVLRHYCSACHY